MAPTVPAHDRGTAAAPRAPALVAAAVPSVASAARSSTTATATDLLDAETTVWTAGSVLGAPQLPLPAVASAARKPARNRTLVVAGGLCAGLALLLVGAFLLVHSLNKQPPVASTQQTSSATVQASATSQLPGAATSDTAEAGSYASPAASSTWTTTTTAAAATTTTTSTTTTGLSTSTPTATTASTSTPAVTSITLSPVPATSSTAAGGAGDAAVAAANDTCYDFYASLSVNPLQVYTDNPDSSARGYAEMRLCTNGTMHSTSFLYDGRSQIVASHIHLAAKADGQVGDGAVNEGPPVINFCGSNERGLLDDGTPYPQPCNQWDAQQSASNKGVPGVLVKAFNAHMTAAQRVADVAARPGAYYFNFHTLASITRWFPQHHGICRGQLQLVGSV